jgi:hypothetical protein
MSTGTTTESGILFGPNGSGKRYISLFYHRPTGARAHKRAWHPSVPPPDEFTIFDQADQGHWRDDDGHYWAIGDAGARVLGQRGERLAHFPQNENAGDPWHGYPVSPLERGDDDAPPDEFVEAWIRGGVVSKTLGRRIQRRKI